MLHVKNLDIAVSGLLVLLGAYIVFEGLGYGYMDYNTPGAGFFPILIGMGLAIFAGVNLFNAVRRSDPRIDIALPELFRVGATSLAIIAFIVLSEIIGMVVSGFLLIVTVSLIFGERTWKNLVRYALVALLVTAALYTIFVQLLGVPVP